MVDRQAIVDLIRAEVSEAIDNKLEKGAAIRAFVEKVSGEVCNGIIETRYTPFYRNPEFRSIFTFILAIFAFLGLTTFFPDVIRGPVQNYLKIEDTVTQAVQRRQYEAYINTFQFGAFASLFTQNNDNCNRIRLKYLIKADIVIPRNEIANFVPSCLDIKQSITKFEGLLFIAEAEEEVEVEVLLVPRRTPVIEDGYNGDNFSLTKLSTGVESGGVLLGRDVDAEKLIQVQIDKKLMVLEPTETMIPITSPGSNKVLYSIRLRGKLKLNEAGHFHTLGISLMDTDIFDKNYIVSASIERNKLRREYDQ